MIVATGGGEEELLEIAGAMHDDVAALTARDAPKTVVAFRAEGESLLVAEVKFEQLSGGPPKPDMGIDPFVRTGLLGQSATAMRGVLRRERGLVWHGEAIELVRMARGRRALRLMRGDRPVETFFFEPGDVHGVLDERLFEQIDRGLPELEARGDGLRREIDGRGGVSGFRIDREKGTLTLETAAAPMTFPLQVLGAYARQSSTFGWAWAEASVAPPFRTMVTSVRERMRRLDVGVFQRPRTWAEAPLAMILAQLAAWRGGARMVMPGDTGPAVLFLALE